MKPIDTVNFWKERIDYAKKQGKEQFSVYQANDTLWSRITEIHKKVIKQLGVNGKVLDAGCGFGRASEWFTDYVGVDFSPDFIAEAKRKYPDRTFVQSDLKKLDFKDKSFDWVIVISIKEMIVDNLGQEEWDAIEKELKRVGKKVLILEYTEPERYEIV